MVNFCFYKLKYILSHWVLLAQLRRICVREPFLGISSKLNQRKLAIEFFEGNLGCSSFLQWEQPILLEILSEAQSCLEPCQHVDSEDFSWINKKLFLLALEKNVLEKHSDFLCNYSYSQVIIIYWSLVYFSVFPGTNTSGLT